MMQQDPNKDIQKPSVKEKLARSSTKKKVGVGEMGKPDLKANFEAAMQKERNTVLNRAKLREEDKSQDVGKFNDWYKKQSIMSAAERGNKNAILKEFNNMKSPKLKSMSKNKLKY
jgi:phosphopentomutase